MEEDRCCMESYHLHDMLSEGLLDGYDAILYVLATL